MAKNNLGPLVDKFLTRSRRRRRQPGLTSTPNITGTRSSFRPVKQGVVDPRVHDVARGPSAYDVASRRSDAQRKRKRKAY